MIVGWGCVWDGCPGAHLQPERHDGEILMARPPILTHFYCSVLVVNSWKMTKINEVVIMPGGIVTGHDTDSLQDIHFSYKYFILLNNSVTFDVVNLSWNSDNKKYNRLSSFSSLILQILVWFPQWKLLCIREVVLAADDVRSFQKLSFSEFVSIVCRERRVQVMITQPITPGLTPTRIYILITYYTINFEF